MHTYMFGEMFDQLSYSYKFRSLSYFDINICWMIWINDKWCKKFNLILGLFN